MEKGRSQDKEAEQHPEGGASSSSHSHSHLPHLGYLGMGAAAVPRGGVHPGPALRQLQRQVGVPAASVAAANAVGALLPQGALPVLDAPAALKPGVGLETHAAAVAQGSALVEVSWRSRGDASISQILNLNMKKDKTHSASSLMKLKMLYVFPDFPKTGMSTLRL